MNPAKWSTIPFVRARFDVRSFNPTVCTMVSVERATRIFTRIDELEQQMDQESELNDLPEKKLATMRDVARAAGVSVSTRR